MNTGDFGSNLRSIRTAANVTVPQVSAYLTAKGVKASEKTIYSWESGRSQPTPDVLFDLCTFYGVDDILSAFGFSSKKRNVTITAHDREIIDLLHSLNQEGRSKTREYVDDLVSSGKYDIENKKIRPLNEQTDDDIYTLEFVARSGVHPDEQPVIKTSKSKLERDAENLVQSDEEL